MSPRLSGKVAIVTGSSSGIGRAIALAFHREGAKVVCADIHHGLPLGITDIQAGGNISTLNIILTAGGSAMSVHADVTNAKDMAYLVMAAVDKFGRLDIMVNNAGVAPEAQNPQPVWSLSESAWDQSMSVNAKGVFFGCKYASAQMMSQEPGPSGDRGWIVNIGSMVGIVGARGAAGYTASKHAVVGLTKSVALDCAPHRIHCNVICPGWTKTPLTEKAFKEGGDALNKIHPFRGYGLPEDIAKAAVFLASEDNSWMTGAIMSVDGGFTCQ
ncbi:putative short chain type dehydrogenase [Rhizodiscina lignyota]|uniref:Short chain type dehydrogenase n=1 Tax=Rhizodiscina lignyota TaxID=1504668 RepID=A0A9P4IV00_9PEZI|nr:putative short chain type dehydrogenase [Rhizodiscina lignyota]